MNGALVPLTQQQRRLWFQRVLEPKSGAYNVATALRLRGDVDAAALERAWAAVVARHEALRARLVVESGNVFLQVDDAARPPLRPAAPVAADDVQALVAARASVPFRVGEPLARAELVSLGDREWLLVIAADHLVYDAWSAGVVVDELLDAYTSGAEALAARPAAPTLAELRALDDAPASAAQRERALDYWRERLDGAPYFALPPDRERPEAARRAARRADGTIGGRTLAGVRALAAAARTTPAAVISAAFASLLARLGGEEDLVLGMPVVDRQFRGTERAVGFFTTTLPLRVSAPLDAPFEQVVAEVARRSAEAYAHAHVAFDEIVAAVKPQRDPGRNPLFSVWLNVLPQSHVRAVDGLQIEDVSPPTLAALFDVGLYCTIGADSVSLSLVLDDDLFESWRGPAILRALTSLLERAVEAPGEPAGAHPLPAAPRAPAQSRRAPPRLLDRIEAVAAATPDRVAVADSVHEVTYAGLVADARRATGALRAAGVGRGDVVALAATRSAGLPAAILGTIGAGATLLLLDRNAQAERTAEYAERVGARLVLGLDELDRLDGPGAPSDSKGAAAYVVVTSGTTGVPHAVRASFDAVANFVDWHAATFELGAHDRFALISGIGHDPVFRDVFTPLCIGATLLVPDRIEAGAPHELLAWLRDRRVSVFHATPPVVRLLTATAGPSAGLPGLKAVFFGGDVLTAADVGRARELAPNARLVNFYGTTETPQAVSAFVAHAAGGAARELPLRVPIGPGVAGAELLVLNGSGTPAGIGELGEIHVRSRFLGEGYVGEPELTAARFAVDGDVRTYATGDLARPRPDGSFDFCGRRDRQHKVRGFRVECAEIERHLRRHRGVADAWATIVHDETGDHVVAYAIPRRGTDLAAEQVRAFASGVLPDYMVPGRIAVVPVLPTTANGKVDDRPLRTPHVAEAAAVGDAVDEVVRVVWEQVLGAGVLDVDANFFDLGGSSLALVKAQELLQRRLGRELPLLLLYNRTTVRSLASALRLDEAAAPDGRSPRPRADGRRRFEARRQRVAARRAV